MTEKPLVSILLPTYNRAHLLPRAIASVLGQTYQNWELLIWNDGSTDDTKAVLRAITDPRVRHFSEGNQGKPYALNQAYSIAHGDLIAFLDDDDEWLPRKLAVQVSLLQENPEVNLSFGNFRNNDKATNQETKGFTQSSAGIKKLETILTSQNFKFITRGWLEAIGTDNFIAMDTVVLRRDLFDCVGPFNKELENSEDFEFWWRAGLAGVRAAYTEDILLIRNKYPGSLSSKSEKNLVNYLRMLDACRLDSEQSGQPKTIKYLRGLYRNTWQLLIDTYAAQNQHRKAFAAFLQSLRYGFRPGALRLLCKGIINKSI